MIFEARLGTGKRGLKVWEVERPGTPEIDADRVRAAMPEKLKEHDKATDRDGIAWLEDDLTVGSAHRGAANARAGLNWRIAPHASLRVGDFRA